MTIPSESIAVISTRHIPEAECDTLTRLIREDSLIGLENEDGLLLNIRDTLENTSDLPAVSSAFYRLGESQFKWVMFDRGADEVDVLPTYNWGEDKKERPLNDGKPFFYQLVPPASRTDEGDEFDDCVTWVQSVGPADYALEEIAKRTGSDLTVMALEEGDMGDFHLPFNSLEEVEAHLMQPRHQGVATNHSD